MWQGPLHSVIKNEPFECIIAIDFLLNRQFTSPYHLPVLPEFLASMVSALHDQNGWLTGPYHLSLLPKLNAAVAAVFCDKK